MFLNITVDRSKRSANFLFKRSRIRVRVGL